ncbi:ABC transporter substrate-binding protein [Ruania sp. N2-46]|uniref:ABC transporter substrate-binding protein n=1 Tax=Occultella gossypii TaxID=2800820 RepID=A0ABS7SG99_9MICO|nr:ABC transporter substrate-binding protein [Occultella gossypii]
MTVNSALRTPGSGARGPSRRSVLQGALGAGTLLSAGALSSCAGSVASATSSGTLVRIWDLLGGSDGEIMGEIVDGVREELPHVTIDRTTLAWGAPYYTKLAMASTGGRAPEAAVLHLSRLIGYAPGGLLEPFDLDLLRQVGITESDFPAALWERALFQDELYALPLDTHPFITFYNPAIAEPAGLLNPDGTLVEIDNPDSLLDAGRAMAEVTGAEGFSYGYLSDPAQPWRMFWGFYGQTGADFDFTPGQQVGFDDGAAVEVLEFMQSMLDGTVAASNSDYGGAIANFSTEQTGLIFSGVWEKTSLQGAIPDLGGATVPIIFGTPTAFGDSHSYVLPRQLVANPERREATYEVLGAILKRGLRWADAGHIPSLVPVVESPEYQDLVPQRNYAQAADWIFLDPPVWFAGSGSDFQNRMSQAMQTALQGLGTAQDAVDMMIGEMNTFLETPAPA